MKEANKNLRENIKKDAKWENWLILLCGIALCSVPWVLSFGFEKYETNVVMWNFLMIGAVVTTTSIIALRHLRIWTGWLSLFMGVWLFFSPFFLVYYGNSTLLYLSLIVGAIIAGLSALEIPIAEKRRVYNKMLRKQRASQGPALKH